MQLMETLHIAMCKKQLLTGQCLPKQGAIRECKLQVEQRARGLEGVDNQSVIVNTPQTTILQHSNNEDEQHS